MKTSKQHMKPIIWKVLGALAFFGFVLLLWQTTAQHEKNICSGIEVQIDKNQFLNETDILSEIKQKADAYITGKEIYAVDINRIETILQKIPFVKHTEVFMDNTGKLTIQVQEKEPLVRVVNNKNIGYYIDKDGSKFEVSSKYTVRVPVVSGYISDNQQANGNISSAIGESIFKLADYIHSEPLWTAMVEQIYVNANQEFIIIPKVGDFEIEMGKVEDLEVKFKKLTNFYEKGLLSENQYESINLKYEKQIVCSLKQPAS